MPLAINQGLVAASGISREEQSWLYLLRVAAFTLLIVAVTRKDLWAGRNRLRC
jgi:hypothetical protein